MIPNVLTIGASDSGGADGVQADLKTIGALGGNGLMVVTALSDTRDATRTSTPLPTQQVLDQLRDALSLTPVHAIKVGLLPTAELVAQVADALTRSSPPVVILDPFTCQIGGRDRDATLAALRDHLLPLVTVCVLPWSELSTFTTVSAATPSAGTDLLRKLGAGAGLLLGLPDRDADLADLLGDGTAEHHYPHLRGTAPNVRGARTALSAALAVKLAQSSGDPLDSERLSAAVEAAIDYVDQAIAYRGALTTGAAGESLHYFWRG